MQRNLNKQQKIEFWSRHVELSESFEGTIEEYCRNNSIASQTFYRWRTNLKNIKPPAPAKAKQLKSFIPVQVEPVPVTKVLPLPDAKWVAELIYHLQVTLR